MTPEEFRAKLERDMPMAGVPQVAIDRVWVLAWERGHCFGPDEIALFYDDLRALALLAAGIRAQ